LLPSVDSIRGFAHAAGFAAARRCLRFLVHTFIHIHLSLKREQTLQRPPLLLLSANAGFAGG